MIVYSFFAKNVVDRLNTKKAEVLCPPIDVTVKRIIAKECIILS
jgi:hypothetical protein